MRNVRPCRICRRSVMPTTDGAALCRWMAFFEWKAIKGQKAKQPYAIAMKDGSPFGIAGIWENWKEPASGEWIPNLRHYHHDSNELVADIHDRMPSFSRRPITAAGLAKSLTHAATVPGRPDADVADFDAGQQARERRSINYRADRIGD
jgi:putative SOS response-associated peptidase YedK